MLEETLNKSDKPALVGIVPRKNLWPVIQDQRWYHIPVESAPRNVLGVEYLAFYFPFVFGEKLKSQVIYYAPVLKIDTVKRIYLFPDQPKHPRKDEDYYQFHLSKIKELPQPIPSSKWRRIMVKKKDIKVVSIDMDKGIPEFRKEVVELLNRGYKIIDKTIYDKEYVIIYILEKNLTNK